MMSSKFNSGGYISAGEDEEVADPNLCGDSAAAASREERELPREEREEANDDMTFMYDNIEPLSEENDDAAPAAPAAAAPAPAAAAPAPAAAAPAAAAPAAPAAAPAPAAARAAPAAASKKRAVQAASDEEAEVDDSDMSAAIAGVLPKAMVLMAAAAQAAVGGEEKKKKRAKKEGGGGSGKERIQVAPQDCFALVVFAMRLNQPGAVETLLVNNCISAAISTATMQTSAGETLLRLDARHTDGEFAPRLMELRQDPTVQCNHGQRALAILMFISDGKEPSDQRKAAIALHDNAVRVAEETRATQAKHAEALNGGAAGAN